MLIDLCDFWLFTVNTYLPDLKSCRLSFLQQILSEEKRLLTLDEIKGIRLRKAYDEYVVRNVWKLVRGDAHLRSYMPAEDMDLGRYPNRDWFWAVCFTVVPTWSKQYVRKVVANRIA